MTLHPDIQKISFTGSVATGKRVMEACSKTLKRVTLELGGNDASIVCPDVDIEKVAPELVMGAMQNSGQVCVATKRIYIHKDIYPQMIAAMSKVTQSLKVGQGNTEGISLGPVQNEMQYKIVKGFLEDSKKNGHKFATGGEVDSTDKGFFITPTIVDQPPEDSRIVQEEPFVGYDLLVYMKIYADSHLRVQSSQLSHGLTRKMSLPVPTNLTLV